MLGNTILHFYIFNNYFNKGLFPNGNLNPKVTFPSYKSVLAAALGPQFAKAFLTFGKLPLAKLHIWQVAFRKVPYANNYTNKNFNTSFLKSCKDCKRNNNFMFSCSRESRNAPRSSHFFRKPTI